MLFLSENNIKVLKYDSIFVSGINIYQQLHGPSMLPDKAKFVECSIISLALSFWMKHLVIGELQKPA